MANQYKRYDEDFKKTIVNLYGSGKSIAYLTREYGVGHTNIRNWITKYKTITISTGEVTNNDEILKLKQELQQVQLENEIFKIKKYYYQIFQLISQVKNGLEI